MKTVLDTAHTWFLEGCTQLPSGELRIRLAEGIKGAERVSAELTAEVTRSYFPVTIENSSRVVDVIFENAHALFTFNESFDTNKLELLSDDRTRLSQVAGSLFRAHATTATAVFELAGAPVMEWFLWTEDQVFQILSSGEPSVLVVSEGPNFSIKRGNTWATS